MTPGPSRPPYVMELLPERHVADTLEHVKRWRQLLTEVKRHVSKRGSASNPSATKKKKTRTASTPALSEKSGVLLPRPDSPSSTVHPDASPAPSVVSTYFSSFVSSGFTPDAASTLEDDFDRLSLHQGWVRGDPERVKQWRTAVESELESQFGNVDKLESWQALCKELGIDPPPTSITQCKKVSSECRDGICIYSNIEHRRSKRSMSASSSWSLRAVRICKTRRKSTSSRPPRQFPTSSAQPLWLRWVW